LSSDKEIEELVKKYCLSNAVKHGGKCNPGAVLGKVLGEQPTLKANIKVVLQYTEKMAKEVNSMSPIEQESLLSKYTIAIKPIKHEEEFRNLPPLPDYKKYSLIVTRFAPNPDSVLHLGSARAIVLSYEYARTYKGKFILRFEDTDPRLKKASLPFYQSIRDDLEWLGCTWDEEYIQSDRLLIYYEYARKLIEVDGAYVCTCKVDDFKRKLLKKKSCQCRKLPLSEHLNRLSKMLDGTYTEGKAVLRVKTDLNHPNPAVRDWPALRIVDTRKNVHARVGSKYNAWPLYNFAAGLDDHLMGVTHIIRGKEHFTNMIRQKFMYDHLSWTYPTAIHYGRLKIEGGVLSKSKIIQGVTNGMYTGFDDPRLATFQALRKRGLLPQAIRQIIYEVNIKPVDATISWARLYSINKKLIDKVSPRYFVVLNPIILSIKPIEKEMKLSLRRHPDVESMGYRTIYLTPSQDKEVKVWVDKEDLTKVKPYDLFRLMGFANICNLKVMESSAKAEFHSFDMHIARNKAAPLIHWLPAEDNVKVKMIDQEAQVHHGFGEKGLLEEPINSVVQLERVGFARIDTKEGGEVTLYFTSK
jgi:glutamyl-tRNA synthetase